MKYLYAPLYRPPDFATVPPGWVYVERGGLNPLPLRMDLPLGKHAFGVIAYDVKLHDDAVADFQLLPLGARR